MIILTLMDLAAMDYKEDTRTVKPGRAIGGALCTALLMKLFLFDVVIAEGPSMMPAIQSGSVLLVNKIAYGLQLPWSHSYLLWWSLPQPGDVVIFYTPHREIAVKRCAEITPAHTFIALGDNQMESYDSRSYGPLPMKNILGKVIGI